MRHQLKPKTPSARARMHYILRSDRYGVKVAELAAAGVANLPSWASGPEDFWAGTDGFERANARLCLELELNLPHELSREGQVAAIADYIDLLSAEAGQFPITWGIHDEGGKNVHCHLMLQERCLDGVDRDGPKDHYKRANKKNPASGGVVKSRWWHSKENVFWSRALWAHACNQALLSEGFSPRFDHRKKSERVGEALRAGDLRKAAALCTQTERHEGVKVAAARRKLEGGWIEAADLPEQVMQIINGNDQARGFNCWLRDWSRTASNKELQLFLADHLHDLHQALEREMHSGHIEARAAWLNQQHAEALVDDAKRTAELEELAEAQQDCRRLIAQGTEEKWLGDSDLLLLNEQLPQAGRKATQAMFEDLQATRQQWFSQQHAEALIEDSERTRLHGILAHHMAKALGEGALDRAGGQEILDNLGAGVPDLQGAIERVLGLRVAFFQAAHAEALAEDADRGRYAAQLLQLVSSGTAAGWLAEDEGTELLYALIDPHTLEWLEDVVAELVAADAEHSYRQWLAVQAAHAEALAEDAQHTAELEARPVSLVEQLNAGLAGLQQSAPDLDDPATPISHDDDADPQWLEVEGERGDLIGYYSDDPDTQWRYDSVSGDWVENDPDHRPNPGPRM